MPTLQPVDGHERDQQRTNLLCSNVLIDALRSAPSLSLSQKKSLKCTFILAYDTIVSSVELAVHLHANVLVSNFYVHERWR